MDPNFFGAPRTGVHAYRVFDIAVVDAGMTVAAGVLLGRYMDWSPYKTVAGLFVLGVVAHKAFGVPTALNQMLFSR